MCKSCPKCSSSVNLSSQHYEDDPTMNPTLYMRTLLYNEII